MHPSLRRSGRVGLDCPRDLSGWWSGTVAVTFYETVTTVYGEKIYITGPVQVYSQVQRRCDVGVGSRSFDYDTVHRERYVALN